MGDANPCPQQRRIQVKHQLGIALQKSPDQETLRLGCASYTVCGKKSSGTGTPACAPSASLTRPARGACRSGYAALLKGPGLNPGREAPLRDEGLARVSIRRRNRAPQFA